MKLFIVDAFTARAFSGNQAGVALLEPGEDFPSDEAMKALAAELKHSETAFVKPAGDGRFQVRYFTPEEEVELCGHATVASFTLLREEGILSPGGYLASTKAGELDIEVGPDAVWMDMAPPRIVRELTEGEWAPFYQAYGLSPGLRPEGLVPMAVSTGLCDVLLPVADRAALDGAQQDEGEVTRLSRQYDLVGVHMFCLGEAGVTAHCRNFAPLYAIPEEAATGTSNGALTYYLYRAGLVRPGEENRFLQGECMGKPSEILSRLSLEGEAAKVRVGGRAVPVLACRLMAGLPGIR